MLDFEKIAELSFITLELGEMVRLDNGMVITKCIYFSPPIKIYYYTIHIN